MKYPWLWSRRAVLSATTSVAAYWLAAPSNAQELPGFDIEVLAKTVFEPMQLSNMFVDVDFLRSWRTELTPRGYEDTKWRDGSISFTNAVFNGISKNPGIVQQYTKEILSNIERGEAFYEENKTGYESFLGEIGINKDSKIGARLLTSMRTYLAISTAVDPEKTIEAQNLSYFWPFC